jgi:ligand-binding sensor domain-containing protein/signal transduction histidine kinase
MVLRFLSSRYLFTLAILLAGLAGAAVPEKDIRFRHLNTSNGLAQGTVNAIVQDTSGYLWLGTDGGLVRYDGYQTTLFKHDPANPASLADNMISAIFPAERGGLWVASYGNLQLYDPASGTFARHLSDQTGGSVLRGIRQIISDGAGGIWVGSGTGLHRFLAGGRRADYRHDPSDPASLGSDEVRALALARDGALWVGTTSGIDRLDPASGRFAHFKPDPRSVPDANRNTVRSMLISGGKLWIGTRQGLVVWDIAGPAPSPVKAPAGLEDEPMIRTLMEDHRGRYWFATERGLVLWDPQSATSRRYRHQTDLPHSLGDDYVYSLYQDSSCILWVGTYFGGASHVDLCREGIEAYAERTDGKLGLSSGKVLGITGAGNGRLWLATAGGGLNLLDPATGTARQFRHDPKDPHSLGGDDATAVEVDRDGRLWVGTRSGMNVMRGESGRFERFRLPDPDNTPPGNYVVAVKLDSRGMMWVGTLGGLYRIDPRSMRGAKYPLGKVGAGDLGDNEVWTICDTGDGFLWVGTSNGIKRLDLERGGLQHYGPEPGKRHSLNHRVVTALARGLDGSLWVSTNEGLSEVRRLPDGAVEFWPVGRAEGLSNAAIKAILPGAGRDLWLSTSAGITRFDPQRRVAEHFNETDGVADTDHLQGAAYRAPDGTLFFGGFSKGLTRIRPSEIARNLRPPPVLITDFKVLNRSQQRAGATVLGYRDNMVSFEFAAPQLAAAEANRYAYRLVGFDPDWIETDATKRTATFTNLSPGDYTFEVKAANKNGVWSTEPRTLHLRIQPPFWQTWPFRILLAALLFLAVLGAYKLRVRHFALQQRKLESQVRERTAELELTQQKLVLNEKMAAIGTLTAGVAHEINNPVNFAHGGAQLLSDELEDFRQFILALAGSGADAKVLQALNTRFDHLVGRTALIKEGTTRIHELVQDLRTFSRLDQAEKKAVPIAENILSTVKLVQMEYAEDTDIVCDLAVNPTLECWPARLNQVFMNLIVNGCQANREKRAGKPDAPRGKLRIQTRQAGQALAIDFADSGNGIPPEVAERMFEPFFTTKPEGEGTGLGLSIAFAIVQKHGGSLSARSIAGQGAILTVQLPLSLAA